MATEWREEADWHDHVAAAARGMLADNIGPAILADMQAAVPVDTGRLKASLGKEMVNDTTLRVGSADVDYAGYVEEGTRNMAAQPYMRPALYRIRGV